MRRSAYVLLPALAVTALVLAFRAAGPSAAEPAAATPWSLKPASSGFTFTWDRTNAVLRDAARIELILHSGGASAVQVLDRTTGTLVVPYTPEAAVLRVDNKSYPLLGSLPVAPAIAEVERPAPAPRERPRTRTVRLPMLLSNRSLRVVATASVVLPPVPTYVHRPHELDLFVKVAPDGKVASVASNYGNDPLRNRLSAVASDAISRWQFDPVRVNSYRDGRVRVVFSPDGVSVRPAG